MTYEAIVIGASAGGLQALHQILRVLPANCPPIAVVQHLPRDTDGIWKYRFQDSKNLIIKEAEDKEPLLPGHVYIAPPDYHLMIEYGRHFSLSYDEQLHYSRPAIDILFETAAEAFCSNVVGVILTGASRDGAAGLARVKELGGLTIVQDPETAEIDVMPLAAIEATKVDHILSLQDIGQFLAKLC